MDQLGSLPMPALITFGAVLAVIFGVRYFGLWQGQQHAPAASAASAQVAAVIVDPTALNKATAALDAYTAAMNKMSLGGCGRSFASNARSVARLDSLIYFVHIFHPRSTADLPASSAFTGGGGLFLRLSVRHQAGCEIGKVLIFSSMADIRPMSVT